LSKDISIIIVNYNVRDLVDNCIASIYKANDERYNIEIFFVDNNSIDGSVELISEKYPEVKVITNDENIGFSKANNLALIKATGEYILILNPDTVLEESTFDKLIEFCRRDEKTGAVTSKLILANGKLDTACRRSFPTPSVAIPRMLGLSKLFPQSKSFAKYNLTYLNENDTYEVDAICGAFMFIPKKVLDEAGFFDEDYFMYGEDLDLCFRIKKAGYKIFYFPEVTTVHFKGESTRKTHLSYVNNFYGAMSIFVKKNFKGSSRLLSSALRFGIFMRSFFSYAKRIFKFFLFPFIDAILLFASLVISVIFRFDIFPNREYLFIISIYVFFWLVLLTIFGVYSKKNHLSIVKTFNAIIAGFFVNSSFTYFFKQFAYSREVVLTSTILSVIFLLTWRLAYRIFLFFISRNILLNKVNLLIVGDEKMDQNVEDKLTSKYNVIHFNEIARKKTISELEEIIRINDMDEVIFTGNTFQNQDILNLMWQFRDSKVKFKILPSGKELILSKINTSSLDELSLIEIEYNISNKLNIFLKRSFDIVLSVILLLTVYPVLLLLKKVFKFKLSKFTSKLLLLPEVFTGKLSFVGYPVWLEPENNKKYIGKKGLTGLIQLNYYEGIPEEEMNNYNIFYAKNQSLSLDIEILLKTIFHVSNKK
jgi:O-antigen biosynthesis protein